MITYNTLFNLLEERNLSLTDLRKGTSQSPTIVSKLQKNENCNVATINKICEWLQLQPGDIMEWIPDADFEKKEKDKIEIQKQIAELQAKLKNM